MKPTLLSFAFAVFFGCNLMAQTTMIIPKDTTEVPYLTLNFPEDYKAFLVDEEKIDIVQMSTGKFVLEVTMIDHIKKGTSESGKLAYENGEFVLLIVDLEKILKNQDLNTSIIRRVCLQ